ncbi:MAG: O-antigen ligase family protein [bacterium]|nr:O-antigen ligase family protein [bacterium]
MKMLGDKNSILEFGKWSFIAGIALLIVRNNNYPWVIKRSSDILFLLAAILTVFFISRNRKWREYWQRTNKVVTALALVIAGVFLATAINYGFWGGKIDSEVILSFGRFLEVGVLMGSVGFFQSKDSNFYKKVAVAQLSTLVYLVSLAITKNSFVLDYQFQLLDKFPTYVYRFRLLDNFPSSVSYYLIVSLSLLLILALVSFYPLKKKFFVYFLLGSGLFGILLWTQTRAGWLGFLAVVLIILPYWVIKSRQRAIERLKLFLSGGLIVGLFAILGFLVMPYYAKNEVINRIFPVRTQIEAGGLNFEEVETGLVVRGVIQGGITPNLSERSRVYLWRAYLEKLTQSPLGLGLNHSPPIFEGAPRGPHNTFLEVTAFGGVLALGGYMYLLYLAISNLLVKLKQNQNFKWPLYLLAALVGLIVASQFDNMSTFRIMWVIMALGIFFKEEAVFDSPSQAKTGLPDLAGQEGDKQF